MKKLVILLLVIIVYSPKINSQDKKVDFTKIEELSSATLVQEDPKIFKSDNNISFVILFTNVASESDFTNLDFKINGKIKQVESDFDVEYNSIANEYKIDITTSLLSVFSNKKVAVFDIENNGERIYSQQFKIMEDSSGLDKTKKITDLTPPQFNSYESNKKYDFQNRYLLIDANPNPFKSTSVRLVKKKEKIIMIQTRKK